MTKDDLIDLLRYYDKATNYLEKVVRYLLETNSEYSNYAGYLEHLLEHGNYQAMVRFFETGDDLF